jgi:PIN domain nuclease of toxin-antitoxin system
VRVLLDTHSLIWAVDDPSRLPATALAVIVDPANDRVLSAASIWELSIKVGQGKITLSLPYRQWMNKAIADLKLMILPITVDYADRQSTLPVHHNDPFDRLIIAQALVDGIAVVSSDVAFDPYGVTRIW